MVPCEVETPAAHGKLGQIWPGRHEGKEEKRAGGRRAEIRALLRPRDPAAGPPTAWGLALTPLGGAGHPPASRGKRAGGEHPSVLPPPSPGCGASPWPPSDLGGTGKTHPCPPPPRREPSPVSVPALPSVCPRVRGSGHAAGCPWGWVGTRRVPLQPRSVLTPRGFFWGDSARFGHGVRSVAQPQPLRAVVARAHRGGDGGVPSCAPAPPQGFGAAPSAERLPGVCAPPRQPGHLPPTRGFHRIDPAPDRWALPCGRGRRWPAGRGG